MILNSLNPAQQAAVSAPLGHQLILAGAGSGKTRVLVHRIAWLIDVENISPFHIMAVTFTNKAAHEMRARIESLLGMSTKSLWIGTFHGLAHRFLRTHWQEAGLPQTFQIIDADDQFRLIRRTIHALGFHEDRFPPKEIQWFINGQKEAICAPHQVEVRHARDKMLSTIYHAYEEACQRSGAVDFAGLLFKAYQLLHTHADLRAHYQARFRCLLVDEFQDTNAIQYAWLKLLVGEHNSIMIVGDDDQSIYGWRGACIENIHRFSTDFPSANIVRLEQNYRSTSTILQAANALIAQNSSRLGKNLWTDGKKGEPITVYAGFNETDEAFFIVNRIRELRKNNHALREIAILYRSNAQSRVLEEALMQSGIPYRVYGGLRFFDRAEIKDALAYLRLMSNSTDDAAFERIINVPTRGIGDRTVSAIREQAKSTGVSLWDALQQLLAQRHFSARGETALLAFIECMQAMKTETAGLDLHKQVETMLQLSGLMGHYQKEKGEKGLTRLENLEELVNAAYQFTQEGATEEDVPSLTGFLACAALESSEEQANAQEDCIQLMTLHAAKGLEFAVVFLAGCEEGLFPHYLCLDGHASLEEERRLCYVGMTRAMHKLYMTYSEERRMYGKRSSYQRPSRFLHEIPHGLIDEIRFRTKVSRPVGEARVTEKKRLGTGQRVHHRIFGEGTVLQSQGEGEDLKLTVRFKTAGVGTKVLIASYLTAI